MPMAQASAERTEVKASRKPSPSDLICQPPWRVVTSPTMAAWASMTPLAASSPREVNSSVDRSTSVKTTVSGPAMGP
jgi:hypothetical protein